MKQLTKVWCSALFLLLIFPAFLVAEDIIWYQMDFPPIYIGEGPSKGMGFQDRVDDLIKDAFEKHGHTLVFKTANMVRILKDLKDGLHVGSGGLLKNPELEDYLYFSEPHSLALSGRLIIRRHDRDLFKPFMDPSGAVSLSQLIQSNNYIIGVCSGRTFGPVVDHTLKTFKKNPNIYYRSGRDMGKGLVAMLLSHRVDCTILFPWEAQYIGKQVGKEKTMISFPLQGMPRYVMAYAAFPKNAWGKKMVELINPDIRAFRNTPEYHKAKEMWLDDESVEQYRRYVREYYVDKQ